jgi:hypothetical protein
MTRGVKDYMKTPHLIGEIELTSGGLRVPVPKIPVNVRERQGQTVQGK